MKKSKEKGVLNRFFFQAPIFMVSIFWLISTNSFSQNKSGELHKGIPSSNAAEFAKAIDLPPSSFTGTPNVTLPVYNLQSGQLSMPIALSYQSTGFKPNEHPGWTGLSWNLDVGGVITRRTNGRPDEELLVGSDGTAIVERYYNPEFIEDAIPDSIIGSTGNAFAGNGFNGMRYVEGGVAPDEFLFNLPGYRGKFLLVTNLGLKPCNFIG